MGCGKRALCRKQQLPLMALVWCNSLSKECLSPSLSIWSSSFLEYLGNVSKEEEVSIWTPKNFLIQEEVWFMPPGQHWRQGEWDNTPWKSVKTVVHELYTQPAVVVSLTDSTDMEKRKDPHTSLELASWYRQTLLQSEHVVPMGEPAENKDHLCLYTAVAKTK